MNKSLRALIAVIVLAFAAAGMYYAWFAPTKQPFQKVDLRKGTSSQFSEEAASPAAKAPANSSELTLNTPKPITVAADKLELVPAPTANERSSSSMDVPPGFTPVSPTLQPLPSNLPGFTPVTATGAIVVAASNPSNASATTKMEQSSATAPSPSTIAVPAKVVAPSTGNGVQSNSQTVNTPVVPVVAPTVKPTASAPSATIIHVVVEGDTLTSIAKQYWGTSQGWENIQKANPGLTPTNLKLGAKLNIPAKEMAVAAPAKSPAVNAGATTSNGDYEIVSGDTLSKISSKVYGDAKYWRDIYDANKKIIGEDPAALVVGTKLTIPAKSGSSTKPTSNATTTSATKSTATPTPSNSSATKPSTTPTSAPTSTPPIGSPTTKPSTTPTSAPTPTPPVGSPTKPSTTPTSAPTPTPPIGSPTKPL